MTTPSHPSETTNLTNPTKSTEGHARQGHGGSASPSSTSPMRASKTPAGAGAVTAMGLLLAVILTTAGVIAVRDALVYAGILHGQAWVSSAAHAVDGVRPGAWMVPAGAALCLLGLWLLLTAVRPRPRKAVALTASTGVFLRPRDIARLVETAAEDVNGVLNARVSATRRQVSVRVEGTGDPGTRDRVQAAVTQRLAPLQNPPTVRVRVEGER